MGRKPLFKANDVLGAVEKLLLETGMPPTIRELKEELGVASTRTVLRYLEKLEEDGSIERWGGARGLRLLRSPSTGSATVSVPLLGEVPAGPLLLAEENFDGWIRMPASQLRPQAAKHFLLRVRGDSMNKAKVEGGKIEDGDLVLVRQQPDVCDGDLVVALIDGEATIKRLTKTPDYIVLKPESRNPEHRPILATRGLTIQGVITRVIKNASTIIDQ